VRQDGDVVVPSGGSSPSERERQHHERCANSP